MTHLSPSPAARRTAPSVLPSSQPYPLLSGYRAQLDDALTAKRAAIAGLEAAWVAAAETDAARHAARHVRIDDRATWDKSTWVRYLAAAAVHEPRFKPHIMRLLREISSIETGLAMPGLFAFRRYGGDPFGEN
jgi:hypothetical protein